MRSAILRRLTLAAMTVIAGGLISATLVRYAPGFGTDERQLDARLSSDSIRAIRDANSEERNIVHFYAGSLGRILHGDFGESRSLNRPVRQLLQERAPVTLRLPARDSDWLGASRRLRCSPRGCFAGWV